MSKDVLSIAVDIGNTNINIGLFKGTTLIDRCDYLTKKVNASFDAVEETIASFLNKHPEFKHADGALIGSVVPSLTRLMEIFINHAANVESKVLTFDMYKDLKMKIDNPHEVGADLIAGIVGALALYKCPCVIADLGTVSKFLVVDKDGAFIGASFTPGLRSAFDALNDSTALLPSLEDIGATDKDTPPALYGKNTVDCMKSGIYWTCVYSVETMLNKCKESLGKDALRIVTGGYSSFIAKGLSDKEIIVDPDLVLKGLNNLYLKNCR